MTAEELEANKIANGLPHVIVRTCTLTKKNKAFEKKKEENLKFVFVFLKTRTYSF